MAIVYYLFFGIFGTIIATFIPGLLNMYSAKISRTQGKKRAFLFATGVSIAIGVLTTTARLLTNLKFMDLHGIHSNLVRDYVKREFF